jgi:membrane protease YdiL (CAAX protease family)
MGLFDDNPLKPPDGTAHAQLPSNQPQEPASGEHFAHALAGDPISYAASAPGEPFRLNLPEDLRISWSWVHLLVFIIFVIVSQLAIGAVVFGYYSAYRHLPQARVRHILESDPKLLVGTSIVAFALMILFLYVTLSVLRDMPFWSSLGWKKLKSDPAEGKGRPWMYFLSGCGLSIFVALAASRVKEADNAPIQEFLKSRTGAMLLMAMAVLVAPLVEETIFRGYLYPVLARTISGIAEFFGMEFSIAIRTGVVASVLTTGFLFGLMHAPQLGRNWPLVGLLIFVGIIFTFARAWTGTVVASFFLHLGYNSMIAVASLIATKGFTHMPPTS